MSNKNIHIFAENVEPKALEQFESAMALDGVVAGALMPDVHVGYSLPIGAVVATEGTIYPSWVGYDIGCGMCALKTPWAVSDIKGHEKEIFDKVYAEIPCGVGKAHDYIPKWYSDAYRRTGVADEVLNAKGAQLGTLGSGNHFIEIGGDEGGNLWIIIHSGSRGLGHQIATHYMKLAGPTGRASEGHYGFRVDSNEGKDYIDDLNFALEFALENRKRMVEEVYNILSLIIDRKEHGSVLYECFKPHEFINRNHNHAQEKDGLWIHRKGATHAEEGMWGVIPGNMRDGSFIVRGKGNIDSLWSSSHGAGRVLGRKKAKETLSLSDFSSTMEGITAKVGEETLDESPMAYKDIFEVMRLQRDLVDVKDFIKPTINIKA